MKKQSPKLTMIKIMNNPAYKGKHVILIAGKVFTAKTGDEANRILDMTDKKYPKEIPEITYIPKADTLILIPPLMERHLFFETFEVLFSSKHTLTFSTL